MTPWRLNPPDQLDRLTIRDHASGYASVAAMASALADEPIDDPRDPKTNDELRASAEQYERGLAETKAGRARNCMRRCKA